MRISSCGRYLICTDTLNKVIVTNWPNVSSIQSVNTEQTDSLVDVHVYQGKVASMSKQEQKSTVVVSDIQDGTILEAKTF